MFAVLLLAAFAAPADLVIENAVVWTGGKRIDADFIAVSEGRFVHVGERSTDLIGPETKRIDAQGRLVIPGLIDAHTHLISGGQNLNQLQLREASSKDDFIRRVKEWADKLPADAWIIGRGWSAESWPSGEQPVKEWIDAVSGGRPAVLTRMDGHSLLANSEALRRSGITASGPEDPAGGTIDRNPQTGEPTGILRETAMGLLKTPSTTTEDAYNGLKTAIAHANSFGITAVSDMSSSSSYGLYQRYLKETNPSMRFAVFSTVGDDPWISEVLTMTRQPQEIGWLRPAGIKAYMDGSLGSRTAYMHEPFTKPLPNQTELRGLPRAGFLDGTYAKGIEAASRANLQIAVHAIGDQANHEILNLYAGIDKTAEHRFRIEHAQHILPEDVGRFGGLGVIPSMQPYHKADDGRYCEEVIGTARSRSSYTFKSFLATQARLSFGSDFPVVTINPFLGMEAAVTSRIIGGAVWMPHEAITVDQALLCYTQNAAYAMEMENEIGQIKNGYRADFVILNQSLFDPAVDWKSVAPDLVYVEGRQAYGGAARLDERSALDPTVCCH